MWKIREVDIANPIVIAPMAGVSNLAFRSIARQFGAGLIYTEMVSDKAIAYHDKKTLEMTRMDKEEHPLTMQLFGHDLDSMITAARYLDQQTECDLIDINMGCPVKKIVSVGSGAALLKRPEAAVELVHAIVQEVRKPVTVKMRLGWDEHSICCVQLAQRLEKAGASAIALHGRTREQMYTGKADWSWVKRVKEAVSIPVIGNGDIQSAIEAERRLQETGCDAVMIGRGVLGDPWLIQRVNARLSHESMQLQSEEEKLQWILEHARRLMQIKAEPVAIKEMRGHACWYIQGMPFNNRMKDLLTKVSSYVELNELLTRYGEFLALSKEEQAEQSAGFLDRCGKWLQQIKEEEEIKDGNSIIVTEKSCGIDR